MFGQQNDKHDEEAKIPDHTIDGALNDEHTEQPTTETPDEVSEESAPANETPAWQHPGAPLSDDGSDSSTATDDTPDPAPNLPTPMSDIIAPDSSNVDNTPNYTSPKFSNPAASIHAPNPAADDTPDDLIDIKQKALGQLSPLVDHLDQTPEDKFRTMMMMIQASDDQSMVRAAYDTAQKIEDEKIRAQALLDIVNEINYFTQHHDQ